jgi:copper chaperone CopZ
MRRLLIYSFVFLVLVIRVSAGEVSVEFNTLGNCSICKDRIEGAVRPLPGVISVNWKIIGDVTSVSFDDDTTDLYIIMHAIANVGHDTEWFPAPDSAYNTLVGTCCEYQRTNNYDSVRVGYLVLMNQWYSPLGQPEMSGKISLSVFPNPATDRVSVSLHGNPDRACEATLHTLSGAVVKSVSFTGTVSLGLENLLPGEYILSVYTDGIAAGRQKIIKR